MNIFSLFAAVVYASEIIISPLQNDGNIFPTVNPKPHVSFSQLPTPTIALPEILGITTDEATPSPAILSRTTKKQSVTIALLGDSMIDTLGPNVPDLQNVLHETYPKTTFTLLNYGVGGTNIDYGLERITNNYTYLGSNIPALVAKNPDIVVVESFGYNPYSFSEGALDKQWLQLAHIVDMIKKELPGSKIVIAATIAPDSKTFGDGALSWDIEGKTHHTTVIKSYLENAVRFAKSQRLPLADAYHPSLDSSKNGKEEYINQGDHIHYSEAGRVFFTKKIADAIISNKLLE